MRRKNAVLIAVATSGAAAGAYLAHARLTGRYEDVSRKYVRFQWNGDAVTNIGGEQAQEVISYERDGNRVTLHEADGNPTLTLRPDGTLCCGPGGPLRRVD